MRIINNQTIQVFTCEELIDALENNNEYKYIYLGSDITLTKGINISDSKEKITIDGTYANIRYKIIGIDSNTTEDTIKANKNNKEIKIRNIDIEYFNSNGVIYAPVQKSYADVVISYENINFTGTQLSYAPYSTTKITNSIINITDTSNITAQEVCESDCVIIGGTTTITSSATSSPLFLFRNDTTSPRIIFLCKSNITLTTETKELMNGTNKLNFTILHDTKVNLTTGNGFSSYSTTGANNVLIDERATLIFIEKSHQRVPMWNVFGTFTMKESSTLQLINSYNNTPSDNYNIYFKGANPNLILDNPKEVSIYTKNANVIYTNNPVTFKITCSRINLWNNSQDLTTIAGGINDLPDYSWYKSNAPLTLEGTFSQTETTLTTHNLTEEELTNLPALTNFKFQSKKEFSIGSINTNIHPINSTKNTISGHTSSFADILIKYNTIEEKITANSDGLFEYIPLSSINDDTELTIIINISGSFLYETRKIITPYNGELSLLEAPASLSFTNIPLSGTNYFKRTNDLTIKVVDSRVASSNWSLFASIDNPLTSQNGYILPNALIFRKFDDENIILNETPKLIYQGTTTGNPQMTSITYSNEKGPLLDLTNNSLEANEEYFSNIHFTLEE